MKPSKLTRNQAEKAAKQVEAVAQKKTRKRIVIFGVMVDSLLIPCVVFLLLASMFTWVGWTQTGTQKALQFAQLISGGALKVTGVSGTLASHFQIDELSFNTANSKLRASGLNVIWQPRSLLSGELAIDTLNVSSLRISQMEDPTPGTLPADLHLPLSVHIKNAALGRLYLATMKKDGGEVPMVQLTALTATLASSKERHVINGALTSPWGALKIQGQVESAKPFALQASFNYLGQAHEKIPNLGANGTLSGSLEKMLVVANAMGDTPGAVPGELTKAKGNKEVPVLKGGLSAVLMAFSEHPLRALDANIEGVNPAHFSVGAPNANLKISVNLKEQVIPKFGSADQSANAKKPVHAIGALVGTIDIQNALPGLINQGALPFSAVQSEMQWSGNFIAIKNARAQLAGGGLLTGKAFVNIKDGEFPVVDSSVALRGINLVKFDSRLQTTQIAGVIHAQTTTLNDAVKGAAPVLIFQAQLNEPRASLQLDASYRVSTNMSKQPEAVLNVSRFDLFDGESRIHGEGEINVDGQQKFKLKAKLNRFDPSHWIKLPSGHIDAEVALAGSLSPQIVLDVQVPKLSGVYGGQNISGAVDVSWKEDAILTVRQLDLYWGKNSLNGNGTWGSEKNGLLIKLDAPELSAMSHVFRTSLTGAIQAELHVAGSMAKPVGRMTLASTEIGVEKQLHIDNLNAIVNLGSARSGELNAELTVRGVRAKLRSGEQEVRINPASSLTSNGTKEVKKMPLVAERLDLSIKGNREQHAIELNARLDTVRKLVLSALGGLAHDGTVAQNSLWSGDVTRLSLSGTPDLLMLRPTQIQVGLGELNVGNAQINSNLGKLALEHFNWKPGIMKTRGAVSDLKLIDILNLVKVQYAIEGDLLAGADWDVQLKDNVQGTLRLARQSGDVRIVDVDGTGQALPLGMSDLQLRLELGGLIAGTDQEQVRLTMNAAGTHLGKWAMSANSHLVRVADYWALAKDAALSGELHVDALDLQWLAPWINPGMVLNGKMKADATIAGTIAAPQYQAQIDGRELEVAFAAEGISLPNGNLNLQVSEKKIKLNELRFSNKVSLMPAHSKFSETNLLGQTGEFSAAGEIDLEKQSGNIIAQFKQFPLLQRKDRWVIVSGQATINQKSDVWALTGKLAADGAYFKLPKSPPPSLSSDVVVIRDSKKRSSPEMDADSADVSDETTKKGIKTYLDVNLELGPQFVFVGSGLDTSLVGTMRLRSNDGAPLRATGTIHTEEGIYEGYGQKLTIERGILNFQGAPGNPGLNILALRKGLEVEAGVEISGTVSSPKVRLVSSDSSMPDAEKLSWLVLGTGTADIAGNQAGVLMSAAGAIFGDDSGRNIPRDIVQGLGFDEISIGAAAIGGGSKLPSQTVAGEKLVGSSSGDQVVSVGKRLRPGLVLSFERGLSDASNALKLSWQLTRRISIVARKGTEGSVDVYYTFSFH